MCSRRRRRRGGHDMHGSGVPGGARARMTDRVGGEGLGVGLGRVEPTLRASAFGWGPRTFLVVEELLEVNSTAQLSW